VSDKSREDTSHAERFFVIAVDGPAASGKGTIAAYLAKVFDLPVLDTGLLYRAVGVLMKQAKENLDDEGAACAAAATITADQLADPELRTRAAGELASRVAIHPRVRNALMEFQCTFARQEGGAVLDGRDIGTVIAPDAPAKLFVTATPEVRANRRWRQLAAQGETVSFEDVLADIRIRDARDGARNSAPMRRADDAVLLDTSEMTIEQAADAARRIVEAARAKWEHST
jgi:cytidylate kinase